jgi:AcrR family transcriptional regulator
MSDLPTDDSPQRRPGRPRLDESDGADVRNRLLESATGLAIEQGFEACGLREIAARAGVSPGMIAYYFGDREGLHEAMFQRAFDRLTDEVERLIERERTEGEGDRLDELIRIHVSALAADPWIPKLLARDVLAAGESALGRRAAERLSRGPLRLIVSWLEREQARGVLRADLDPRLTAITIASLSVFPFLVLPILGGHLGIALDDALAARLIEHNQRILSDGVRVRSGEGG